MSERSPNALSNSCLQKSVLCDKILFTKLILNSLERRQQWLSTTTYITRKCVLLLIPFRCHASWPGLKKVNKQNRNRTSVHSNCTRYRNTATNGRSSAKSCFSLPTFLCYSSSNNTLRNVTWYREKTNAAILSIDHVDVIAITREQLFHNEKIP